MEPLYFEADETIFCDNADKWFTDYIPLIPSESIINKTITGFGATTAEINAQRHSIIILPNVATIHNKQTHHGISNNTFSVYEGISIKKIASYLKTDIKFKKLLTTPESFAKILEAFRSVRTSPFNDYFVLIDEQHKYIKDIGYRPTIAIAMDSFFKFKNKALISSTPIKPSDPRFDNFKCLKLQPTYTYKKEVEILFHNNLIYAVDDCFKRHPDVNHFIFFNSVNGIQDLIKKLDIGDNSVVFCSKESASYLKTQEYSAGKYYKAASEFTPSNCLKYNFLTSSFYNGLDIILDNSPQVIMVSLPNEPKTHLDPFTDVIQILGRFRKTDTNNCPIFAEAIHLVKYGYPLEYQSKDELTQDLKASQNVYDNILKLMYSNPSPLEKKIYIDAIERLPFHKLTADRKHFNRSNTLHDMEVNTPYVMYNMNYFMIDKTYEDERIKSYYGSPSNLMSAYKQVGINAGREPSFEIYLNERLAPHEEKRKLNLRRGKRYSKENVRKIVLQLTDLDPIGGNNFEYDIATYNLTDHAPLIRYAFDKLGRTKLAELEYSITKIKQALIDYDVKQGKNSHPLIDSVYNKFTIGISIPLKKIKETLQEIYLHYKLPATAKASDIKQWFDVKESKIIHYKKALDDKNSPKIRTEERAYILLKRLFRREQAIKITAFNTQLISTLVIQ